MIDAKNELTLGVKRADLHPPVRSYADRLSSQIEVIVTAPPFKGLQDFLHKGPTDQLSMVAKLMAELDHTVAKNEILYEKEFDDESFTQFVMRYTMRWTEALYIDEQAGIVNDNSNPFQQNLKIDLLNQLVEMEPKIPTERFIKDSSFLQQILEAAIAVDPFNRNSIGLIPSLIYNHSVKDVPPEEQNKIHQEINLDALVVSEDLPESPISFLGFKFPGGKLVVKGLSGNWLGCLMSGGNIQGEYAGDKAGYAMSGGKLQLIRAGNNLGQALQEGGVIEAELAANNVGKEMEGGYIKVKKVGDSIGLGMYSGVIEVEQADDCVGEEMNGGEIKVTKKAQSELGLNMRGGKITVHEATDFLGEQMEDGEIFVQKTGFDVGSYMKGGIIHIQESMKSISPRKDGGQVYLNGVLQP